MYETVINPQTFIAVFSMTAFLIDVSVSIVNIANKIVLILLCKECTRVGKIWGILFILVCASGYTVDPVFCMLISNLPIPSKNGKHPTCGRSFSVSSIIS